MSKSQVDGGALLVAVAAAALSLMLLSSGQLDWLSSICGLALFLIVLVMTGTLSLGFREHGFCGNRVDLPDYRCNHNSARFCGIRGATGADRRPHRQRVDARNLALRNCSLFLVDRARMAGRVPQAAIETSPFPKVFVPVPAPVMPAAPPPVAPPAQEPVRPVVREAPVVRETPVAPPPDKRRPDAQHFAGR